MTDRDGETKKPGLFGRMFGRKAALPESAPELAQNAPVIASPEETRDDEPRLKAKQSIPSSGEPSGDGSPRSRAEPPVGDGGAQSKAAPAKPSWWKRLKSGLARSSSSIGQGISDVLTKRKLDSAALEDLEDILVRADLGVGAATRIVEAVGKGRYDKEVSADEVRAILAAEVEKSLAPVARPLVVDENRKPFVVLVVGVNGSGKTTTIAKLAQRLRAEGKSVTLAAGDTFRAAAIEQLKVWGDRLGAPVISGAPGADAAGLAFDALTQAREKNADVVLMDTAGRLQNRAELMAELEKIVRVMKKVDARAPHAVILVLDATVGQNALSQVEIFGRVAGVTGLVMTKLDGTARGGILVAIADKFGLPVHFIGVGESADDLEPFAAADFARAIAGLDEETKA
ncbi:MAG: signal recognition particle-docking protein FtsY [Rhodoblastus sp.]